MACVNTSKPGHWPRSLDTPRRWSASSSATPTAAIATIQDYANLQPTNYLNLTSTSHLHGRQQTYHQSWKDTRSYLGNIADHKDRVKAHVELTDQERVRPLPVDVAERDEFSARIHESEPSIPTPLCTELAHMFLASGTAASAVELQHIMRFQVAHLWDCICFPLATPGVPAFLDSKKASFKTTRTAMSLCMELTFQPAPASSMSFSFDLTKAPSPLTAFTDNVHSGIWAFVRRQPRLSRPPGRWTPLGRLLEQILRNLHHALQAWTSLLPRFSSSGQTKVIRTRLQLNLYSLLQLLGQARLAGRSHLGLQDLGDPSPSGLIRRSPQRWQLRYGPEREQVANRCSRRCCSLVLRTERLKLSKTLQTPHSVVAPGSRTRGIALIACSGSI